MSDRYVPLAEKDRILEVTDGALECNLHLPVGVDIERILVNAPRLGRLTRLAGANKLHVLTADQDRDGFELNATDVHMQSDGTATLTGMPKPPKKKYADHEYDDSDHPMKLLMGLQPVSDKMFENHLDQMYKGGPLAIYLNKKQIEKDIWENDSYQQGLIDAGGWAAGLDKATKRGLISASQDRYFPTNQKQVIDLGFNAFWMSLGTVDVLNHRYVLPAFLIGTSAARRIAQLYRVTTKQLPARDYNWSLFTEYRVDRVVATAAVAHSGKLFKVAK